MAAFIGVSWSAGHDTWFIYVYSRSIANTLVPTLSTQDGLRVGVVATF